MENKIKLLPRTREVLEKIKNVNALRISLEEAAEQKQEEIITNNIRSRFSPSLEKKTPRLELELQGLQERHNKAIVDFEKLMAELPHIFLDEYGLNETHAKVSDEPVSGTRIYHAAFEHGVDAALNNLLSGDYQPGRFRENLAGIASYWGCDSYYSKNAIKIEHPILVATLNGDAKVHEINEREYVFPTFDDCKDSFDESDKRLLLSLNAMSGSAMPIRCIIDVALGYDACKVKREYPLKEIIVLYNRGALTLSSNPISTLGEALKKGRGITQEEKGEE